MPSVTFGGIISGLDTNSIIDGLVKAEKQAEVPLQTQQNQYSTRSNLLTALISRLSSLKSAASGLSLSSQIRSVSATSSNTAALTVAAASTAIAGTHTVDVTQLAQAGTYMSQEFTSTEAGSLPVSGTLTFKVGTGSNVNITVNNGDTLSSIADQVNNASPGVAASVLNTGTGYRLVIQSRNSGDANAVTFSADPLSFTEKVKAQDAKITFDSVPDISRSTNVFSDLLPGVTVSLVSKASSTITIANDRAGVISKVKDLVTAYNNVATMLRDQLSYSGATSLSSTSANTIKGADTLFGDAAAVNLQRSMSTTIATVYSYAGGTYMPADLGLSLNKDGTLKFDSAKLDTMLQSDPQAAEHLLLGTGHDGLSNAITSLVTRYTDSTIGVLTAQQSQVNKTIKSLAERIQSIEDGATSLGDILRTQFAAMEQMISAWKSQSSYLSSIGSLNSVTG